MAQMLLIIVSAIVPIVLIAWFIIWATRPRDPTIPRDPAGIRTNVTFLGAEQYMKSDESLDDTFGCGAGLLEKLAERLQKRGLETGDVTAENWGAKLEVVLGPSRLDVDAGFRGDDWLIVVGYARGSRASVDNDELRTVLESVHEALQELEGIERVAWHRTEDASERGSTEPFDA
jgi:hypothetical protein